MDQLLIALDVADGATAGRIAEDLRGTVGGYKIGSRLFTSEGPATVRAFSERGDRVFLDLKFHDIPNTVASAVRAAADLGVTLLDVHALGGAAMIEAAAAARPQDTRLLAITILTSHDESALARIGLSGSLAENVRRLALLARDAGADGVVASPQEVELIRQACGPDFLIVTPGIRPAGASHQDQARVATPQAALAAGASYLVVGRPITGATDPAAAARAIVREMAGPTRAS